MHLIEVPIEDLATVPELLRTSRAKAFTERLRSSIEEMGLAEPLKVARAPEGSMVVIDGALRLQAIREIRAKAPDRFASVPAYLFDYARRFEIRFQSDIYQDLLPSQMASLVEHLHEVERVQKADIARYIGVSPATLRNYTGLWRLIQRGGLFARIVELMDAEVIPSSNPYAWLRLSEQGLRRVLEERLGTGQTAEEWLAQTAESARAGRASRFTIKQVEAATSQLPPGSYREDEQVRTTKQTLGRRRAVHTKPALSIANLDRVVNDSSSVILSSAARAMREYLR